MKSKKFKVAFAKTLMATMIVSNVAPTMQIYAATNEHQGIVKNVDQKRNVMYYGDWSVWGGQGNFYPQDIPADQLTHLNFAFLDFESEGNLIFTDKDAAIGNPLGQAGVTWGDVNAGILPALVELRAKNPNLKIGVSIGGWSKSGDFSEVAANPAKRARFLENVMKFVEYTNMDFVDIDWEYPASVRQPDLVDNKNDEGTPDARPEDKENYILLLQDLRNALDKKEVELGKTYELSVALPASRDKLEDGVDIQRMFEIIDFGNLMTYDMRGAFDPISGHQTPLYANSNDPYIDKGYSIDQVVNYMVEQGASAEKLVVGAAYYTRGWEQVTAGTDAKNPGLFGEAAIVTKDADHTPSRGANNELPVANGDGGRRGGVWSYRNLDRLKASYQGLQEYWDDEAKAPYLYSEQTGAFFTYDNVRSVIEKAHYVNDNNLGGVIAWMASNDASTTSSKRDELTKATKKGLFGEGKLTEYEIVYAGLDIEVAIRPYNESWGNTGGYEISIKNNERLEESGEVLSSVEKIAETITLPKLYIKHTGTPLMSGDYTAGTVTQDGEYTVVDFGSIWDGKAIEPGQTYTFKLKTTGQVEDVSSIESIELVQRISKSGEEIKRQTIYGDIIQGNQAPVIKGANDKAITVGQSFDPMAGVSALDKEDGDLTANVVVEGEVNVNEVGTYTLTYMVTDSEGLKTTLIRTITVEPKLPNQAPVIKGVTDKTVKLGETFDKMAGVTAADKEDGDLTDKIVVEGEVDTNQVGPYTLTYTVVDSEGAETSKTRIITVEEVVAPPVGDSDFGVGQGIEWPAQVNAPFADMTLWNSGDFSVNGALNLKKVAQDTGVKFFNLGFIQATGGVADDKVNWGWGGYSVLNEKNADNTQYQGIKQAIKDVRALGGDVAISLGGLNGTAIWQVTQDVDVLYNTYKEIVTGYGLTKLDLDIEGGEATNKALNEANAKAIKRVQDETGVEIVLTLAVLPSGLTPVQLDVLEAYLSAGVDVELVNIMTMCYGSATLLPGENYGTASLRAVESTKDQLKAYFKKYANIELTDAEAYRKIGTTVSVGFEGEAHPIFVKEWTELVVEHAIDRGIGMTSMWSINRDSMADPNKGIYAPYEHTNFFKNFGSDEVLPTPNTAPKFSGLADKNIIIGEAFDALAGVTAYDKEDGDLTSQIEVSGSVDTMTPGEYTLTYTVTDSEGLTTIQTIIVTVEEDVVEPEQNEAPVISGAKDKTIVVGEAFNALAGVTAYDKEDGDLTSQIEVSGNVDTMTPSEYRVTYSVTDNKGLTTIQTIIVTVEEDVVEPEQNEAPVISGAKDKTIVVGDAFDALAGVTAYDKEDGDLTSQIEVSGNVDTMTSGEYRVTYTVTDSKGLTTTKTIVVIVKEEVVDGDTYDPTQIYYGGEIVIYKGQEYKAKWWTQGEAPGTSEVWEKIVKPNEDGTVNWYEGMICVGGEYIVHNGQEYKAKWWTNSTPGSDESWELIK
ncbi:glycosyl hydrolase family 18 protein [Niameybacter massiliensis]|uniref:glycosyl hydrolase family 18 protein n=1 Tax=Niameybacter massiliensis TaxID=1658108 RepID=UPI0009E422C5|nr:glycosyl hydrolase family 18 protein [Niameybacter massiliensis]